ncbi:hypothetical protein [Brachyspira murdochii]|uniref:hypothetical protein n=1 Tax=Brachyspira murdochii TaxID=84378 RepID=UPI0015E2BB28|nr:hypothetical protein [Brachyspira murdochii]
MKTLNKLAKIKLFIKLLHEELKYTLKKYIDIITTYILITILKILTKTEKIIKS